MCMFPCTPTTHVTSSNLMHVVNMLASFKLETQSRCHYWDCVTISFTLTPQYLVRFVAQLWALPTPQTILNVGFDVKLYLLLSS